MNDPSDPSLEVLILLLSKVPPSNDQLLNALIALARYYVEERFSPDPGGHHAIRTQ